MRSQKNMLSKRRKGIALLIVTAMSVVAFPMVGLSVDVGILYVVKTKLSSAADAAALAGARSLSRGADVASQAASAQTTAQNYFNANFPTAYLLTTNTTINTTVTQTAPNMRQVVTTATATVPVAFLRLIPSIGPTVSVSVSSTVQRRDSNVVIVMDRSGSLQVSGSCAPMKAAAAGFVNNFAEQRDYLGLATFASSGYYMDYPIGTTFKSSSPSITGIINNVTCVGGTSSAMGLWNGYTALANLNQPGALNVIIFFTDGDPTALSANFPIKLSSGCANKSQKLAVLSMTQDALGNPVNRYGLMNISNGPVPVSGESSILTAPGCAFYTTGPTAVGADIAYVPNLDLYGDSTNSGYKAVTGDGAGNVATDPTSIMNASINAADQAARHIRNGDPITAVTPGAPVAAIGKSLSNVIIFSIGLGTASTPPNADFLMRVANDPGASSYDNTKQSGLYVFAQTAADLNDAFQKVAAEILRIAK